MLEDHKSNWLQDKLDNPKRQIRWLVILLVLVPCLVTGFFFIWLSGGFEPEHWTHIFLEFGVVLIAFSIVDVLLHTVVELLARRPTKREVSLDTFSRKVRDAIDLVKAQMERFERDNQLSAAQTAEFDHDITDLKLKDIKSDLSSIERRLEKIEGLRSPPAKT